MEGETHVSMSDAGLGSAANLTADWEDSQIMPSDHPASQWGGELAMGGDEWQVPPEPISAAAVECVSSAQSIHANRQNLECQSDWNSHCF